jgi:hypothetical protein
MLFGSGWLAGTVLLPAPERTAAGGFRSRESECLLIPTCPFLTVHLQAQKG